MKELSIEEKAKRYDEAIERARLINNKGTWVRCGSTGPSICEQIFPELKESEDERVGKAIIKHFRQGTDYTSFYGFSKDEIIAWLEKHIGLAFHFHQLEEYIMQLEKQGEQKSLDEIAKEVTKNKDAAVSFLKSTGIINENGELADEYKIEQDEQKSQEEVDNLHNYLYGEQKSSWSEEDEKIIIQIKKALEDFFSASETDKIKYWLNFLKNRIQPQNLIIADEELAQAKKDAYNDTLDKIEYHSGEPTFDDGWSAAIWYLKKRNARPQLYWKPSDEQMNALWSTTEKYLESDNENVRKLRGEVLESLYEDLKKLRNE